MPPNPACRAFLLQLSPFVDGELRSSERSALEAHLASCPSCAARVADLRAESGLIRVGMELLADEVDWRSFTKGVMARVAPAPLPLAERWRVSLRELFMYRRGLMFAAVAGVAVIVALAPLVLGRRAPDGYASDRLAVQLVTTDPNAHVAPVVMSAENGNAIIWLVSHKHVLEGKLPPSDSQTEELDKEGQSPQKVKMNQERKRGGEL